MPCTRQVDDATLINQMVATLLEAQKGLPPGFVVKQNEFEKDDDSNFHMDFISAFGNLRARNYGIEEIDKFQAKLKAGRIIPAIATTTAMATGFVCLELYKQLLGLPFGSRRNLFANLALPGPLIMLSEPMPCAKIKSGQRWDPDVYMDVDEVAYPEGHSLWDKLIVPNASAMTLQQLIDFFAIEHNLALQVRSFEHDGPHSKLGLVYVPVRSRNAQILHHDPPTQLPCFVANRIRSSHCQTGAK